MSTPPFHPGRRVKLPPPEDVIRYFNERIEEQKKLAFIMEYQNRPLPPPPPPQEEPIYENVPRAEVSKVRRPIYVNAENLLYENVFTVIPGTEPLRAQDPKNEGELSKNAGELAKNAGELPKNKGELPKNEEELPKNAGELPKNEGELSKNAEELPKNAEELPKNEGELSKNAGELPKNKGELPKNEEELAKTQSKKWTRYRTVRAKKGTSINYVRSQPIGAQQTQLQQKSPPPYIVKRPDTSKSKEPLERPDAMQLTLGAVEEFLRSVPGLVPPSADSTYIWQLITKPYKKENPKATLEFGKCVVPTDYREPELLLNDDVYPFNLPDGWAKSRTVKKRDVYIDHNSKSNYFLHPAHQITQSYEFPKQLTDCFDCPKMLHHCSVIGERQIFYNLVKQYNKIRLRNKLGAPVVTKTEFRYEPIPFWIQIYAIANKKYDDKINWHMFGLDELEDFLEMLKLQFEEDRDKLESDHEYNRSMIAEEIESRFFGKVDYL